MFTSGVYCCMVTQVYRKKVKKKDWKGWKCLVVKKNDENELNGKGKQHHIARDRRWKKRIVTSIVKKK